MVCCIFQTFLKLCLWELRSHTYIWHHIYKNLSNGMVNTCVCWFTHQDASYISKEFYNPKIVSFGLFSAFHSQLQDLVIGFSIVITIVDFIFSIVFVFYCFMFKPRCLIHNSVVRRLNRANQQPKICTSW